MRALHRLTLVVIACAALVPAAQAQRFTRCPEGTVSRFTGHPLYPVACEKKAADAPPAAATTQPKYPLLPPLPAQDKAKQTPTALIGKWEGLIMYAGERFLLHLDVKPGRKKGSFLIRFISKNYRNHHPAVFWLDIKPGKAPGLYTGSYWLDALADQEKPVAVAFGAPASKANGHERAAAMRFEDGSVLQEARFTIEAGKLRFSVATDAAGFSGEMIPTEKDSV